MSTSYQASQAKGSRGETRSTKCRHTVTLDRSLFETIRKAAMAHGRSVSEEMAARLADSIKEVAADA
jgi:hypothetical protein